MLHIASPKSNSRLTKYKADDVQPNAIDLRVDKIFKISNNTFILSDNENKKEHRGSEELQTLYGTNWWRLEPGAYEIVMENIIEMGPDEAGWVITRSTLNRNGVYITSGLYDSGYHGVMAGALHVTSGAFEIERGTRVGQFLLFKAESLSQYNGSYGIGKEHDKKYTGQ